MMRSNIGALVAVAFLAACGPGEEEVARVGREDVAERTPGQGDPAPAETQAGGTTMSQMRHWMEQTEGVSGDSLQSILPYHRTMVANMISRFNHEMMQMGMDGDAAWTATVDSLRQDLVRMPDMSQEELAAYMPAHRRRVTRLMDAHAAMMERM